MAHGLNKGGNNSRRFCSYRISQLWMVMVRTMIGIYFCYYHYDVITEICRKLRDLYRFFFHTILISCHNLNWQSVFGIDFTFWAHVFERVAKCQITFSMCWKILCLNRHRWRRISGSWCDFFPFLLTIQCTKISSSLPFFLFRMILTVGVCLVFLFWFFSACSMFLVNVLLFYSLARFFNLSKCKKRSDWNFEQPMKASERLDRCYYAVHISLPI